MSFEALLATVGRLQPM